LQWRAPWAFLCFLLCVFGPVFKFFKKRRLFEVFLTDASFSDVMKYKADFVVSCGSQAAGVNFILSQNHLAKSISILTPGLLSQERFDVVVLPEHDKPKGLRRARLITQGFS
jgi:mitochondrial fission protein ELM1